MNRLLLILTVTVIVLTGACSEAEKPVANANTAPPKTPQPVEKPIPYPDVPRIQLADARSDFDNGNAIFIDTRPAAAFDEEHVKGAMNITADDFAAKADALPKGKKIIAYCS